jgi:uncharacterized protein YuzE
MRLVYDPEADVLSVLLSNAPVAESDQDKPGVILDYDAGGNMVGFEILDASKRMANPMSVEYAVTPPLRQPTLWRCQWPLPVRGSGQTPAWCFHNER